MKKFYTVLIFVLSVAAMVYFFPRQGKFKYEYQKGRPWMHEDLIAQNDFPIYKTSDELLVEKREVTKDFKPFFRRDDSIGLRQISNMKKIFSEQWRGYFVDRKELDSDFFEKKTNRRKRALEAEELAVKFAVDVMGQIYKTGILKSEQLRFVKNGKLHLLEGKVYNVVSVDELYTFQTSYSFVKERAKEVEFTGRYSDILKEFTVSFPYEKFIDANLNYDKVTSDKSELKLLNSISLFRGMIQQGERIVSRGELVNDSKFIIIESLRKEFEKSIGDNRNEYLVLLGQVLLVGLTVLMLFFFMLYYRKELVQRLRHVAFILFLIVIIVVLSGLAVKMQTINIYVIPFVLIPIFVRVFFDGRLALFTHFTAVLLVGFFAPNSFEFVFINFLAGFVAIYSLTNLYHRRKLFMTSILVMLTYFAVFIGMSVVKEGSFADIDWMQTLWFAGNGLLILAAFPLIYLFEKIFGFLSDATLMELSDTNQPLLRKLAEEAPGTFQHSMQVANLAEEAIHQIGGNPLLVRNGALYHDIGKLSYPEYFIENQGTGFNPHDKLSNIESAEKIIGHVTEGMNLARKYKLPVPVRDFIRMHHGDSIVKYFYYNCLKEEEGSDVDIKKFTYPGPKPNTKETAVLMMADSVEAASRTLKEYTEESIKKLVEGIISSQQEDGQFDDSDLTLRDIRVVKELFVKKLLNIYHARVEYPKEATKEETKTDE
ncbi:MAG: HDIG domain-containing protein [Bacteroidales bacterium]|jgi:putative nucleotidyltransferase with HDIG domain|nr:HDIG domain-containing protein [Bacteroidales bacterium]